VHFSCLVSHTFALNYKIFWNPNSNLICATIMEDEVRLRTSVTFGYSPSNRLPVKAHHKQLTITYYQLIWVLTSFNVRLVHDWTQHANWWLLHRVPHGNLCVTTHPKTYLALGSLHQWCYPQRRPYHALFREMPRVSPKHPQCLTVTNSITFIPSLDYPSIWPRKLAISLCLLQDISSWNRLILLGIISILDYYNQ